MPIEMLTVVGGKSQIRYISLNSGGGKKGKSYHCYSRGMKTRAQSNHRLFIH